MSRSRLAEILEKYQDELAAGMEAVEDEDEADVCAVLQALSRGERPPEDAARRVAKRARER